MMAISLWQPWASLVALGIKRIETRSWQPPERLIGERIAIHAAKKKPHPVDDAIAKDMGVASPLPLGAIIGTARLAGCKPITRELRMSIPITERVLGDYSTPGRFAWLLDDAAQLVDPTPMAGRRGFFNVELPVAWMQPCTRCKGPRTFADTGNGRCAACRAETGEAWPR